VRRARDNLARHRIGDVEGLEPAFPAGTATARSVAKSAEARGGARPTSRRGFGRWPARILTGPIRGRSLAQWGEPA
jgi:hypothetical protein